MTQPTKQELIDHVESLVARCAELTRQRDHARRQYCRGFTDFCPNPEHDHLSLEDAAVEVAKSFGWNCFKEESK